MHIVTDTTTPTNGTAPAQQHRLQSVLFFLFVLYLAFVIYGSLVPLQYVDIPLDEAVQRYSQIRYLDLGIQSRADWVANILLFIPLAFLLAALSFKPRAWLRNATLGLLIVLSGFALALGIEFVQLYFPQRTVSINDIIAETLGAVLGVGLFYWSGPRVKQYLRAIALVRGQSSVLFYLLISYGGLFFFYHILPLDLTLSPVELYKKWQDGRIILLPFSAYSGSLAQVSYAIASDILLWLPITLLWLLHKPQQAKLAFYSQVLLLAAVLEFCQLFVYSRVTDSSDIACALLAAALAHVSVALWARQRTPPLTPGDPAHTVSSSLRRSLIFCGAVLLYSIVLLLLFWYPFDFNFDWGFIHQRWQVAQNKVFLQSLYFGTEYRAITALAQKVLTFLPLGVLFALLWQTQSVRWQQKTVTVAALCYVAALAGIIEALQLALPGKTVDITDVVLQFAGAAAGFSGYLFFYRRAAMPDTPPSAAPLAGTTPAPSVVLPARQHPLLILAGHLVITLGVLWLISQLTALPYNVRELLTDNRTAILGVSLSFYLMSLPLLRPGQFALFALYSPAFIVLQSALIFGILSLSVATESVYDIVGSPVSGLPPRLELLLRFAGFFCLIQFNYLFAGRVVQEQKKLPALIIWASFSLLFSALWYVAVVHLASTDNITELLANGGSYGVALGFSLYLALLFGSAAYIGRYIAHYGQYRLWRLCIIVLLSFILSWWLLNAITESLIVKYQRVFSALQFLLSADRANYAPASELLLRYAVGHTALLLLLAWFYLLPQRLQQHRPAEVRLTTS